MLWNGTKEISVERVWDSNHVASFEELACASWAWTSHLFHSRCPSAAQTKTMATMTSCSLRFRDSRHKQCNVNDIVTAHQSATLIRAQKKYDTPRFLTSAHLGSNGRYGYFGRSRFRHDYSVSDAADRNEISNSVTTVSAMNWYVNGTVRRCTGMRFGARENVQCRGAVLDSALVRCCSGGRVSCWLLSFTIIDFRVTLE